MNSCLMDSMRNAGSSLRRGDDVVKRVLTGVLYGWKKGHAYLIFSVFSCNSYFSEHLKGRGRENESSFSFSFFFFSLPH